MPNGFCLQVPSAANKILVLPGCGVFIGWSLGVRDFGQSCVLHQARLNIPPKEFWGNVRSIHALLAGNMKIGSKDTPFFNSNRESIIHASLFCRCAQITSRIRESRRLMPYREDFGPEMNSGDSAGDGLWNSLGAHWVCPLQKTASKAKLSCVR